MITIILIFTNILCVIYAKHLLLRNEALRQIIIEDSVYKIIKENRKDDR